MIWPFNKKIANHCKVDYKTNIDWDKMNRETTANVRALVNRMNDFEVMNSYGGYSPVYVGGARDAYYQSRIIEGPQ